MTAPWGGTITVPSSTATQFVITITGMPANVCPLVKARLSANAHFTTLSTCGATAASFSATYISNP
jgi:hypothetical protein